jgi:nitrite reductase/ring-hydroxylating ferredoxin subunit
MEASREFVCREGDIPERDGVLVELDGREVGIFKLDGRLVAYENRCVHQGGPVCTGRIVGRYEELIDGEGYSRGERLAEQAPRLICPWHGWEFDLATGQCMVDRRRWLRRHALEVRDGDVYIEL